MDNVRSRPGFRLAQQFDVFDGVAFVVADHVFGARRAGEPVVECQFQTFLAAIVEVRHAEDVREHFAARVIASVFALRGHAGDPSLMMASASSGFSWRLR